MSDNIQTNTTGRLTPCLQKKIDKTTYLVEVHFSSMSTQSVEDKLKRVILHDLEHGKEGRPRKSDKKGGIRHGQVATGVDYWYLGGGGMLQGAFTISFADEGHVAACGYVDLVPGNKGPDKLKKAGFTPGLTFEPAGRNNWHIHHAKSGGGQMLICISGWGWYQAWGEAARELGPGAIRGWAPQVEKHAQVVGGGVTTPKK